MRVEVLRTTVLTNKVSREEATMDLLPITIAHRNQEVRVPKGLGVGGLWGCDKDV